MWWWPGASISWRWVIRYTCLALLGLWVGLWALSYLNHPAVIHNGSSTMAMGVDCGGLVVLHYPANSLPFAPGWHVWYAAAPGYPFTLSRIGSDFLEFRAAGSSWGKWDVRIPLSCPIVLMALVSLFAWRKTTQRKMGRGFLVEPLASRQESAG